MNQPELTTEKQKMLAGQLYFPSDKQLQQDRNLAKLACHRFNRDCLENRKQATRELISLFASNHFCWIEPNFYCDYGYNIRLGKQVYFNHNVTILDAAEVEFGDHVLVGPNVVISTATHPLDPELRKKGLESAHPIVIESNVWIGAGANILPGITIGENSVVAAGALVNRDVPANTVVAGVPARKVKTI